MLRYLLPFLLLWLILPAGRLAAQVRIQAGNPAPVAKPFAPADTGSISSLRFRLPSYVQQNPSGYSPLCRLELKLENRLPVSAWVKIDEAARYRVQPFRSVDLQVKLLRF
ncbi:MAG: hypothetical protein EAZ89_12485 [Bacteroidetes bacterium]|nr:MAG: hypothetical protein EAZ89_12485 [Bacteroidota bacterium]